MNPFNSITSIIGTVLFFVVMYFVVSSFFKLLAFITPALLIGALILNWKVYPDYGQWLWALLQRNPLMGIGAGILTVVAMPVVAGFLFVKALLRNRLGKMQGNFEQRTEGQFTEFEEVDDFPETKLDLPEIPRRTATPENNVNTRGKFKESSSDYEQLFD